MWHSSLEFTLGFSAAQVPETNEEGTGLIVRCPVVARVRIPVAIIFDVIRALNESMTRYENIFGEIRPPQSEEGA